jgi:hypothetical protein
MNCATVVVPLVMAIPLLAASGLFGVVLVGTELTSTLALLRQRATTQWTLLAEARSIVVAAWQCQDVNEPHPEERFAPPCVR